MPNLFYTPPKDDPRLLFAREKELHDVVANLKEGHWIVLLGPRRVGKTSLAKCAIRKLGWDAISIDARENNDLTQAFLSSIAKPPSLTSLDGRIQIAPSPLSVGFSYTKQNLGRNIDEFLKKRKRRRFILLLDEAQWFRNPRQVLRLLAHLYDYYYETVTPIITGSSVGVMKSILEPGTKSPLYGRPLTQLEVRKWTPSISLSFLSEGLKQNGLRMGEELMVKTVDSLDGLPGWLTMFGYYYTTNPRDYDVALKKTMKEALKIVDDETRGVAKLARGWQNHYKILMSLTTGRKSFKELLEATGKPNSMVADHLDMLQRLCYVEKSPDGSYSLVDPIFKELLSRAKK